MLNRQKRLLHFIVANYSETIIFTIAIGSQLVLKIK